MSGLCHKTQFLIVRNMCMSVFTAQGYSLFVVVSPQKSVVIGKINVAQLGPSFSLLCLRNLKSHGQRSLVGYSL